MCELNHKLHPMCIKSNLLLHVYVYLWCRSDTSRSELAELAKQANPDEIDIDDDDEEKEDEDEEPDGESSLAVSHLVQVSVCLFCSTDLLSLVF